VTKVAFKAIRAWEWALTVVPVALALAIVVPLPGGAGVWAREDVASAARCLNKETSDSDTIYVDGSMVEPFR
jgi:hypothetical protein